MRWLLVSLLFVSLMVLVSLLLATSGVGALRIEAPARPGGLAEAQSRARAAIAMDSDCRLPWRNDGAGNPINTGMTMGAADEILHIL